MNEAPVTHPSLLVRLRDRADEQAWCEFTEIYGPLVLQVAKRRGFRRLMPRTLFRRSFARSPGPSTAMTRTRHAVHFADGFPGLRAT